MTAIWVAGPATEKLILEDLAPANVESSAIEAEIVQVPAPTNATTPVDELTVQIETVELVKLFAPAPADAVAVSVGGGELCKYAGPKELESIVRVRDVPHVLKGEPAPEALRNVCERQVFIVNNPFETRNGFAPKTVTEVGIVTVLRLALSAKA